MKKGWKRFFSLILCLVLCAALLPSPEVHAADSGVCNGMMWKASDGNVTINGYTDALPANLTIPSTIDGKAVTSIGDGAFQDRSSLTGVTIPTSVTSIGEGAFSGCSNLTSITIPEGVTSIGVSTFSGCSSLKSVTIPAGVTSIGWGAFSGCSSLTSVTIPASVTSMGVNSFSDCSSLKSVTIPTSVTSIGWGTFSGCTSLTSVTIPASVTSIGKRAFSGCSILAGVTIPAGVTSIGDSAFCGCSSLASVTIPAGVTSIGANVFEGCSSLAGVTIPASVTSIGGSAFSDCSKLTTAGPIGSGCSIEFGWKTSIPNLTFSYCKSLKSVTIPTGVTSIGDSAFLGCSSLTNVTIPASVTSIGDSAFLGCSSLTNVTIPASVTSIGYNAFHRCTSLSEIRFCHDEDAPLTLGAESFYVSSALATSVHIIDPANINAAVSGYDWTGSNRIVTYGIFAAPVIASQPTNQAVDLGKSYTFAVTASGEEPSYAWYYKFPGESGFTKSSCTTASYTNVGKINGSGMQMYCVVTDKFGSSVTSNTATLFVHGAPCQIVEQPQNQAVNLNATYTFSCGVAGEGLSYTWYYKFPGDAGFTKSSCTTASYSNVGKINGLGMQMYCVVRDKHGNTATSRTATLFVYGAPCQIVSQPQNQTVNLNASYTFTCGVAGEGLSYAWYYKFQGDAGFTKSSCTTASYTNTARAASNGMQMYCVVRDKNGNTKTSRTATLTVNGAPCQIVQQPQNQAVNLNATYTFSCGASGEGLSYTWYYKFPGESGFTKSSCTTASYSNVGKINGSGMQMYCVVRDKYGNTATSRTATLFVYGAPCQITEQPKSQTVAPGASYTFTCGVAGEGLSYAWYYKFPGDAGFTKSSCTTASYSNTARTGSNGLQMYCVVTDKYGNTKTSNTVTLTVN